MPGTRSKTGGGRVHFSRRSWFFWLNLILGLYIFLPFFAPLFMHVGWLGPAKVIYFIYSWLCHQLPERSFFLFGPQFTYSLAEVQAAWQHTINPLILRQFIGSPEMGWKVAWSDRMVSMYASTWVFGLLWWPVRSRLRRLPWWGFALLLLPMAIDGLTHFVSDLAGIEAGFRDANGWLVSLTHAALPSHFYAGTTWGSFNSLMRLISGVFFGIGVVWFGYPYLEQAASLAFPEVTPRE